MIKHKQNAQIAQLLLDLGCFGPNLLDMGCEREKKGLAMECEVGYC